MRKKIFIFVILGGILAALIFFLSFFYIQNVEIVGSTRYTDSEISQMTFSSFMDNNSLYLSKIVKTKKPDVVFIDSIDIEYINHNTVRLHVNEDSPIGYIEQDGKDYYFDVSGKVLEAVDAEENTASDNTSVSSDSGESVTGDSSSASDSATYAQKSSQSGTVRADSFYQDSGEESQSVGSAAETDSTAQQSGSSGTDFVPALTDVTEVKGLTSQKLSVGAVIKPKSDTILNTIMSLSKMMSKFEMPADLLELDEENNITLYYGDVRVNLGGDTLLEEKMTRAAAILPQLSGMSGVLHLETYSEDTNNIIFDPDGVDLSGSSSDSGTSDDSQDTSESSSGSVESSSDSSTSGYQSGEGVSQKAKSNAQIRKEEEEESQLEEQQEQN